MNIKEYNACQSAILNLTELMLFIQLPSSCLVIWYNLWNSRHIKVQIMVTIGYFEFDLVEVFESTSLSQISQTGLKKVILPCFPFIRRIQINNNRQTAILNVIPETSYFVLY